MNKILIPVIAILAVTGFAYADGHNYWSDSLLDEKFAEIDNEIIALNNTITTNEDILSLQVSDNIYTEFVNVAQGPIDGSNIYSNILFFYMEEPTTTTFKIVSFYNGTDVEYTNQIPENWKLQIYLSDDQNRNLGQVCVLESLEVGECEIAFEPKYGEKRKYRVTMQATDSVPYNPSQSRILLEVETTPIPNERTKH